MATQAAMIAETIAGMKRTLSRKYDSSESDSSIDHATNRGHKLKRKAQFTHEGQLHGQRAYKKQIEHAGYSRYVLSRNPRRYDCYGDELEDEDEENADDAVALADDPYSEIKLEEILKPLTSAAELPNHPSLSYAYTSPVLEQMVKQACEMVRREERTLWQVKKLAMTFRGDPNRITGEEMCSTTDSNLFEPKQISLLLPHPIAQSQMITLDEGIDLSKRSMNQGGLIGGNLLPTQLSLPSQAKHKGPADIDSKKSLNIANDSICETVGGLNSESRSEIIDGQTVLNTEAPHNKSNADIAINDATEDYLGPGDSIHLNDSSAHTQENEAKAPSHRMTTRAQAHFTPDKTVTSALRSTSPAFSDTALILPIFQIPSSAIPNTDRALPPMEAEETRTTLFLWVQKQEEVVRGAVRLYEGLLKADRMRKSVFGWCKAEGHLGEMSDGEDWYDREEWGLHEGLRKGQEEEEDETVNQSKKTRGRRAQ